MSLLWQKIPCRIVGPYYPVGEVDWRCTVHRVDAVLRDPARHGATHDHRREEFRCPVGEPVSGACYSDHEEDIRTKGACDFCRGTEV